MGLPVWNVNHFDRDSVEWKKHSTFANESAGLRQPKKKSKILLDSQLNRPYRRFPPTNRPIEQIIDAFADRDLPD
jgi:hypothetical protein